MLSAEIKQKIITAYRVVSSNSPTPKKQAALVDLNKLVAEAAKSGNSAAVASLIRALSMEADKPSADDSMITDDEQEYVMAGDPGTLAEVGVAVGDTPEESRVYSRFYPSNTSLSEIDLSAHRVVSGDNVDPEAWLEIAPSAALANPNATEVVNLEVVGQPASSADYHGFVVDK